ncbi:hypothetical protein C8J56DRAFT_899899 [Mycena floridula]|nr:hypothetical protein C8J56DRAFT_899899 [Mycena floridula]
MGITVSGKTVERLKMRISDDDIQHAVNLAQSGHLFYTIFDNINIFLRKFQQRITNKNSMIHATHAAVIAIDHDNVDLDGAEDLNEQLKKRGKHHKANFMEDVMLSPEDDDHLKSSFRSLVTEIIVKYTLDCKKWKGRREMLEKIRDMMPKDRPLPPKKTDAIPLRVFDVNEGSKKSIIQVLAAIQTRLKLIVLDWSRKRDRFDDWNSMERLDYVGELSALWHYALQATHMLMRVHLGHEVLDPTSLSAHQSLLQRKWDGTQQLWMMVRAQSLEANPRQDLRTAEAAKAVKDDWHAHDTYFICDALLFCVFEQAVSFADPARVLRVMRYWALSYQGASQHNYARECVEGIYGRSIALDLYLEQLNFWVRRVFIGQGNGVTVKYIIEKGSACVEAFRDISHLVANFFGDPDRAKRLKSWHSPKICGFSSKKWYENICTNYLLIMRYMFLHSAIADVLVEGAKVWNQSKFTEFIQSTSSDPALGYPIDVCLNTGTSFDDVIYCDT